MIHLLRYARIVGIDNCAIHGVRKDGQIEYGCGRVWAQYKREQFLEAIARAQQWIEEELGFPIGRKAVCDEQIDYNWRTVRGGPTRWTRLLAMGQDTIATIQAGVPLTLGAEAAPNDPVSFTVTTTVTDPCEIHVYHTGANGGEEIESVSISIAGGIATIRIPRCHLVNPALIQPEIGFDYNENDNFVDEVDVKRVYVDTTTGISLLYQPCGLCSCCTNGLPCANTEQEACAVVVDAQTGALIVRPAEYGGGSWTSGSFLSCRVPFAARVSYVAGYNDPCSPACDQIPPVLETAIFHLSHTEMPQALCTCSIHNETWALDRKPPDGFQAWKTLENPFGTLRGQIYAWRAMQTFKRGAGGVF